MNDRPLPHNVQSGIVTEVLRELIERHPELINEIKQRLAPLPEPVSTFIFRQLKYPGPLYDLRELTQPWIDGSGPVQSGAETVRSSRGYTRRSSR